MIKHVVLGGVALLAIAASAPVAAADGPKPSTTTAALPNKPQLGTWGVDLSGMDKSVKPGDSFFDFANGTWVKNTEIPADRASWGAFTVLANLSDQRTREIIEAAAKSKAAPGTNEQKVGDLYASYMDEAAIEAKGIAPLKPWLEKIAAIKTKTDLARYFGEGNKLGLGSPFGAGVGQDFKDNSRYSVFITQGGLGMPDRDYYFDDKHADTRTKYLQHVTAMLKLAGLSDPATRAQRVYDLEKKIASGHWNLVEQRQIEKIYNPMTPAEMAKNIPGFDFATFLQAASLSGQPQMIVMHPSALAAAAKLVQSEPLDAWKDYLNLRAITASAGMLPKAFVEESFAFNGKTLQGTPQLKDRWKRGTDLVGGGLGEAVGQLYVAKHFTPEAKAKADKLVRNLIAAMDKRLAALEWMAPETKAKARVKLAAFTPKIGYPDKWRDYSSLEIVPGDLVGNALRIRAFNYQRNLSKMGKPVDRAEWAMTPQTVNAYANPLLNEIVFPAAILQAPFFDPNADDAVNYGAIGAGIGHEISHHFDDQGMKFDPKGNLSVWWKPEDVAKFKALAEQVVQQYAAYEPLPGSKVNGELTLGENIADLAGLTIAYDAYRMSLNGKEAPVIDGYTGDQRFFLGYAQIWRTKYRDAALKNMIATNEHTPAHYRPTVVRNFDPWYKAFNVKDGALYLPPEKRIRIW
jgi:putative endopeptidase